ncbi:recombinase family protein [Streptomyces sp. R41]|uniref:Recombinase family protein n=1 Tax=Streptomyces sp. R41 TaxID=3238632 RepID=A0AB39RZX6_9ACTN
MIRSTPCCGHHENIHIDKVSGGAKAPRPTVDLVVQLLRDGDTLKVSRLDRLSP